MNLLELTAPYKTLRVVDYHPNGNTVLIKNRRLQHIAGSIYKDREDDSNCNVPNCRLYAYYPEIEMGIYLDTRYYLDEYTPEDIEAWSIKHLSDSFQHFLEWVRKMIQAGAFIKNTVILLLENHAPELAKEAKLAKAANLARKRQVELMELSADNDTTYQAVLSATKKIRDNSSVHNSPLKVYEKSRQATDLCLYLALMDIYGVAIPANARGKIEQFTMIEVGGGKVQRMWKSSLCKSSSFSGYLEQMVEKVIADTEDAAVKTWRAGLLTCEEEIAAA